MAVHMGQVMAECNCPQRATCEPLERCLAAETPPAVRPLKEWREEFGPVLWWKFPITEPPYVGTPLDLGRTVQVEINECFSVVIRDVGGWPGYHTHWTPIEIPKGS